MDPDGRFNELLAKGVQQKRKPAQKGVQAIFTSDNDRRGNIEAIVGLSAIGAGAAIWTGVFQALSGSIGAKFTLDTVSSPLMNISLGFLLMTGGVGLCTYFLAVRRTRRENNKKMESAIYDVEASLQPEDNLPYWTAETVPDPKLSYAQVSRHRISKTLAVALVQGFMLMVLYGWLVEEYTSNVNMQTWIRDNFALGIYLLNYNAVLIIAGLLGVVFLKLLRAR